MLKPRIGIVISLGRIGGVCLTVVALLVVYAFLDGNQNASSKPLGKLPAPTCSFKIQSFCTTQASMKQDVTTNDFSDVLEGQLYTAMRCNGSLGQKQYCQTGDTGATLQLFQVQQQNSTEMLTRNQYLTLFMTLKGSYGPLQYVATSIQGNDILMSFRNQSGSYAYKLLFVRQGSAWKVSYPSYVVVQ